MTEKQRFLKALSHQPYVGKVPTFELVFYLTMELLEKVHPSHRKYDQWNQMEVKEREIHLSDMAQIYIDVAKHYGHSAIFVHPNPFTLQDTKRLLEIIREKSGDEYFIMMHGDSTFAIPDGDHIMDFSVKMYEELDELKSEGAKRTEKKLEFASKLAQYTGLLDGFALCSDYCFNTNPFYSREQFGELIVPELKKLIHEYHELGFKVIKHTDGNIMPIVDMIVECKPDALHSLDPQGGVDLAEVKRLYGDKVAICGNVNCGLLQTGTQEECIADVRRSLHQGMEGYGYIFSTSNCVYIGMPLERYELMNKIWREEGIYH